LDHPRSNAKGNIKVFTFDEKLDIPFVFAERCWISIPGWDPAVHAA